MFPASTQARDQPLPLHFLLGLLTHLLVRFLLRFLFRFLHSLLRFLLVRTGMLYTQTSRLLRFLSRRSKSDERSSRAPCTCATDSTFESNCPCVTTLHQKSIFKPARNIASAVTLYYHIDEENEDMKWMSNASSELNAACDGKLTNESRADIEKEDEFNCFSYMRTRLDEDECLLNRDSNSNCDDDGHIQDYLTDNVRGDDKWTHEDQLDAQRDENEMKLVDHGCEIKDQADQLDWMFNADSDDGMREREYCAHDNQDEEDSKLELNSYAKCNDDDCTEDNQTYELNWMSNRSSNNEWTNLTGEDVFNLKLDENCKLPRNQADFERDEERSDVKVIGDFAENERMHESQANIKKNEERSILSLDHDCNEGKIIGEYAANSVQEEEKYMLNWNTCVNRDVDDCTHDYPEDIEFEAGCGKNLDADAYVTAGADGDSDDGDDDCEMAVDNNIHNGQAETDAKSVENDNDYVCSRYKGKIDGVTDWDKNIENDVGTPDGHIDGVTARKRNILDNVARKESNLNDVVNGRKFETPAKEEESRKRRKSGEEFETICLVAEKQLPGGTVKTFVKTINSTEERSYVYRVKIKLRDHRSSRPLNRAHSLPMIASKTENPGEKPEAIPRQLSLMKSSQPGRQYHGSEERSLNRPIQHPKAVLNWSTKEKTHPNTSVKREEEGNWFVNRFIQDHSFSEVFDANAGIGAQSRVNGRFCTKDANGGSGDCDSRRNVPTSRCASPVGVRDSGLDSNEENPSRLNAKRRRWERN